LLKQFELEEQANIESHKSGKQFDSEAVENRYFSEILEKIKESKAKHVVIAGPGFTKNKFENFLKEKGRLDMQLFFAATNSVGKTGLQELLKAEALSKVVQDMQLVKETKLVESFLAELGRDTGLAEYGFEQVQKAVEAGAVKQLMVADKFLLLNREKAEKLMEQAEKMKGEVHLINAEHEAGEKLLNMGGIAALLRYRIH